MTASEILRAHIEAIPAEYRSPWHAEDTHVMAADECVQCITGSRITGESLAALIALVASPGRVLLLAEHLKASTALAEFDDVIHEDPMTEWADRKAHWLSTLRVFEAFLTTEEKE